MVKAYVLIIVDPSKTKEVLEKIRQIPEVVESHEVMGPFDIVAEIEAQSLTDVPPILSSRIRGISGVESTTSLVTFPDQ